MYPVSKHDALVATLAYADVFDYSLTRRERALWFLFYSVAAVGTPKNKRHQEDKWKIAEKASRWLSLVPTIQLVGVTGGLAMNNAKTDDDIDLFFIVADGTLWVSRMFATLLMDVLGLRRRPNDTSVADKVCLNMFMTAGSTGLPKSERDCFTAHEVLQMTPLWEQRGAYQRFLLSNRWVSRYLPNAWKEKKSAVVNPMCASFPFVMFLMRLFEWPARRLQLWYMARHRTHEVITDTTLRFHPRDARVWVKRRLAARLRRFHIPLDKIFYAS